MNEKNMKSNGENREKVTTLPNSKKDILTKNNDATLNPKSSKNYFLHAHAFSLNFWGEGPSLDELVFTNV